MKATIGILFTIVCVLAYVAEGLQRKLTFRQQNSTDSFLVFLIEYLVIMNS